MELHRGPTILKINPLSPLEIGEEKTDLYEGRRTPSVNCQTIILGLSNGAASATPPAHTHGLRPPCSYPLTRIIILKGHPMSPSEANSFQFTWGEPTCGLAGLYSVNNIVFLPSLSTDYVL